MPNVSISAVSTEPLDILCLSWSHPYGLPSILLFYSDFSAQCPETGANRGAKPAASLPGSAAWGLALSSSKCWDSPRTQPHCKPGALHPHTTTTRNQGFQLHGQRRKQAHLNQSPTRAVFSTSEISSVSITVLHINIFRNRSLVTHLFTLFCLETSRSVRIKKKGENNTFVNDLFLAKDCNQALCVRMTKSEWMVGHMFFLKAFMCCDVNWGNWITSHTAYVWKYCWD